MKMGESLVEIRPLGWGEKLADLLMVPLMYLLAGTFRESPQRTHPWNIRPIFGWSKNRLEELVMFHAQVVEGEIPHHYWWDPLFHIPFFWGWRQYVVLGTYMKSPWYVGWRTKWATEVSLIPQTGSVRVLVGSEDVSFFAVDADGIQIPIYKIGEGRIGDGGIYSRVPLS